ncbi:MAG TPA: hypothetical protein DDZ54_02875 [Erythrobacter sp.]|nr:hypothetical protein [Erythrobacter sp.]HBR84110.1 hypothetical protein [Erythrobacter sp.]
MERHLPISTKILHQERIPPTWSLRADGLVVLGMAFWVLLVRSTWIGNPIADIDDQLYSFIGQRLLEGDLPFVDWWDRKPFGLFAIFAFAHAIGGPGAESYQLLAAAFTLAGAILTYHLARDLCDRVGAALCGGLYVVLMSLFAAYSGQSENFHVPLMLVMVLLLRRGSDHGADRRAYFAMLIGGIALQIKYTVLPQCMFFGAWALLYRYRRDPDFTRLAGQAALYALLGLAPTVAVTLLYAALGQFEPFFYANFVSFFERGTLPGGRLPDQIEIWIIPVVLLVSSGLYSVLRVKPARDPWAYRVYGLWFLASLATVFLPSSVYQYYLAALAPSACLLVAPLFDRRSLMGWVPGLMLVGFNVYLLNIPQRYDQSRQEEDALVEFAAQLAPFVDANDDCMFVYDGPTVLYRLAGSCARGPIIYPDHFNNRLEHDSLGVDQLDVVRERIADRPPVIVGVDKPTMVQSVDVTRFMRDTLARDYHPFTTAILQGRLQIAYLRNDLARTIPDE